jgi:hypothetical protein
VIAGGRRLLADHGLARAMGAAARAMATARFGLDRFVADWQHLLDAVAAGERLS